MCPSKSKHTGGTLSIFVVETRGPGFGRSSKGLSNNCVLLYELYGSVMVTHFSHCSSGQADKDSM